MPQRGKHWVTEDGKRVLVHADGGDCHGTVLELQQDGGRQCPICGICPDMQSTEFWSHDKARYQ